MTILKWVCDYYHEYVHFTICDHACSCHCLIAAFKMYVIIRKMFNALPTYPKK